MLVCLFTLTIAAAMLGAQSALATAPTLIGADERPPLVIDDGGLPLPNDHQLAPAAARPIGMRPTNGPGLYDVVVAGVTTSLGAPPATSSNAAATIAGAAALWETSAAGTYGLDYRTYVAAAIPGSTCDLETLDQAVDSAVSAATNDGVPRPGRVGLLVVVSFANNDACAPGQGWLGASSFYVNGYWGADVAFDITAHEAGHNFLLGHSGAMACAPPQPQYPAPQTPTWPCTADASNEYLDLEAMMGAAGLGLRPLRIPASQLQVLNVLDPTTAVLEVGSGAGTFDLVPPLSGASGPQSLRLDVPNSVTGGTGTPTSVQLALEYRPETASNGGPRVFLDVIGDLPQRQPGASTWVYRGNATNDYRGTYGLTAGSTIKLADGRVVTVQSVGTTPVGSATSIARVVIAAPEVPGAPTGLVATPGNGQASVAFVAPANTGGAPISNYEYSINNGTSWTARNPAATGSPLVITGLTNGTAYQVKLRAVNSAGPGAASAAVGVTPVAPVVVPGAPTRLVATPGNGQASVAFVAPSNTGGAPITNYEYSTNNGASWTARNPVATGSPLVITGLMNGTTYQVRLRAVNSAGPGTPSVAVSVTPVAPVVAPGAPTGLVATPGNGQASIAFVAPVNTGGATISNYEFSTNNGASWTPRNPASATSPVVITGLANGTTYQVKLRAVNAAGAGAASTAVGVTPTAPPTGAVFVPSAPIRAYDSRNTGGALSKDQSRVVDVKVAGYPAGTVAIAYNVTVTDTVGAGWLAVTPGDATGTPTASTINWDSPNATLANGYVVGVSPAGAVRVVAGGHVGSGTQFVIDVVGFYVPETPAAPGAVFVPVDPARAYNSITSGGPLGSGQTRNVSVAPGGVPAGATGVAYNLTVTNTSQQGWLAVTPQGTPASGSSINWTQPGQTYANGSQGQIASNAVTVTAGGGGSTDFIIDVTGYFVPVGQDGGKGTRFTPLAPVRAFDSRSPGGGGRLNSGNGRTTSMTTGTGVPVGAAAVVYNLTETETASGGYLAVAPGGATTNASTINWFRTGQDMANGTVVKLNPTGQVTTTAGGGGTTGLGSTQYLIDIAGYYQ